MDYAYFDIWPSLLIYETPSIYIFNRVRVLHLDRLKEGTWLHSFAWNILQWTSGTTYLLVAKTLCSKATCFLGVSLFEGHLCMIYSWDSFTNLVFKKKSILSRYSGLGKPSDEPIWYNSSKIYKHFDIYYSVFFNWESLEKVSFCYWIGIWHEIMILRSQTKVKRSKCFNCLGKSNFRDISLTETLSFLPSRKYTLCEKWLHI